LSVNGYTNLIGSSSKELDLRNQMMSSFFAKHKPEVVIDAAAKVERHISEQQLSVSVYNGEHANPK
jgi:dTDP-4-dehydrorhamnose reductase